MNKSLNLKFSGLTFGLISLALVFCFSACSKINICGKDSRLVGDWTLDSYNIGDSSVALVDTSILPDTISPFIRPIIEFTENGDFNYIFLLDTTFGNYRMERYERKCLLYIDLFEYRWEITRLSTTEMDIASFYLFPNDSLVSSSYSLSKLN